MCELSWRGDDFSEVWRLVELSFPALRLSDVDFLLWGIFISEAVPMWVFWWFVTDWEDLLKRSLSRFSETPSSGRFFVASAVFRPPWRVPGFLASSIDTRWTGLIVAGLLDTRPSNVRPDVVAMEFWKDGFSNCFLKSEDRSCMHWILPHFWRTAVAAAEEAEP